MSLPRYPEYKASGVEWLGEVPGHWLFSRHKYIASYSKGKNPTQLFDEALDGALPYLSMDYLRGGVTANFAYSSLSSVISAGKQTLIIWDGSNAGEFVQGEVGIVSSTMAAALIKDDFDQGYYWFYCQSIEAEMRNHSRGMGIPHVNGDELKSIEVPFPPIEEQQTIAAFLDSETGKIDALIAEQQRLVELLAEKRQAVISHAVTKGLNPDAPMKDSGIEWLGEVPEHWEVGPLKRYWSVTDCKHVTAEFVENGVPLASIREVQSRWVALEDAKCTTEYFYELLIEGGRRPIPGDLIFSRNATVGEVAQVNSSHPRFAMGQDVVLLRKLSAEYSSDYLQHVIRSPIIILQLANMMIGSTFKRINVEEIRSFIVSFPSTKEQAEIATFLESETERFDNLTAEANRAIELLQERRSALISAAVTGKIDVRTLSPSPLPQTGEEQSLEVA